MNKTRDRLTGVMTDPLCALNGRINGYGGLPP